MKILFACDLDNTILYSYKKAKDGDVLVEMKGSFKQGYMTSHSIDVLKKVKNEIVFLPISSRSIEQYKRINFGPLEPKYAVLSNGGRLLVDGMADSDWEKETEKIIGKRKEDLAKLDNILKRDQDFKRASIIDSSYYFCLAKEDINLEEKTKEYQDLTDFDIVTNYQKLYFFPKGINKGEALKRFKGSYQFDLVICAGDGKLDLPMLDLADIAIVPEKISGSVKAPVIYINKSTQVFSDFVVDTLSQILSKRV